MTAAVNAPCHQKIKRRQQQSRQQIRNKKKNRRQDKKEIKSESIKANGNQSVTNS